MLEAARDQRDLKSTDDDVMASSSSVKNDRFEPPRLSRRPHILRGWGHGSSEQVLTGGAGAGGPDGDGAPGGARVAVGGDRIDRGEDRLFDGGPTEVGTPGRT